MYLIEAEAAGMMNESEGKRLNKGIIRSYANTNHLETARWNTTTPPEWMNFVIVQTESNYNTAIVNNPDPIAPTSISPEFKW